MATRVISMRFISANQTPMGKHIYGSVLFVVHDYEIYSDMLIEVVL